MKCSEHTVGAWLHERAALTPERLAIDFDGRLVSYAALAESVSRRVASFAQAGLAPGDRVATLARNCPEQVEVFFACALSRLIMVPLSWRLTPAELAYQLADAEPACLLAEPALRPLAAAACQEAGLAPQVAPLAGSVPGADAPRLAAGETAGETAGEMAGETAVSDDDPLLILYTSGTTGRPKGAVLTHANCFWTNLSLDRTAPLSGDDVVLQVLPQCHVGGWNVQPLLAWWQGATVVLEQAFDAARVLRLIAAKRVTTMMGVPTNYLMLATQPGFADADLSSLRQVLVGGAAMPRPLIETWLARGVTIMQGYGLTEAAPNVLCVPPEYASGKAGSAGKPYLHVRVALRQLAADGGPAAVRLADGPGVGELVISGPNVFAGYWRNPEATAAAVRDGWLGTGDVAERDADGFYWIRGRLKEMYISGGENVYPAEIEQVLLAHAAIKEAAVIGVPDERWGETGLAYVVLCAGWEMPPDDELTGHCRARLAAYKVPRHYRAIGQLPRLVTGKIDRRGLSILPVVLAEGQGQEATTTK